MAARRALVRLTEARLAEIRSAELGIVVLSRAMCGRCHVYQADIERLMDRGEFSGIPFGKFVLDDPSSVGFLEANSWAQDTSICPITIIYQHGKESARISTARAYALQRHIVALGGHEVQGGHANERHRDGSRAVSTTINQPVSGVRWHFSSSGSSAS